MKATEEIRNWGIMLLFVSSGSLIYCFLLPSGNISRTAKRVISITVLSIVLFPLMDIFVELPEIKTDISLQTETADYEDFVTAEAVRAVEELIAQVVKKYTSVPHRTEIFIDKTQDGSINIEYAGIVFSAEPQRKQQLREALFEALGIMPDIKVEYVSE